MAKHIKSLSEQLCPQIGSIIKPDGSTSLIGKETHDIIMSTHFPQYQDLKATSYQKQKVIPSADLSFLFESWLSNDRIQLALLSFKDKKSPGPDGMKPVIFKHFPLNIIKQLQLIYKAIIKLHFTPTLWKDARVIFIPKPGKSDYTTPKSFRPISLSNYLLKVLEKLLTWHTDEMLLKYPIHIRQHGFQTGKCTETAISHTVNQIEKFILNRQHCIGLFLDIQAAFDTISPAYIKDCLTAKHIDSDAVSWYYDYLTHRNLHTNITGHEDRVTISTGFPQGGVCSAKFWIIAFDRAIEIINSGTTKGFGFADDICVLAGGSDIRASTDALQHKINLLTKWGDTCGLKFSPAKSIPIVFKPNYKPQIPPKKLKIYGKHLNYATSTRYLGVILDDRLSWGPHWNDKIPANLKYLRTLANKMKQLHGPKPRLMKWIYTGIIRPRLAYGAMIWSHCSKNKTMTKQLYNLNRAACMMITTTTRSTPQASLEILYNIPPLDIYLQEIGLTAYARLQSQLGQPWHSKSTFRIPHITYWNNMLKDALIEVEDDRCNIINWDKRYHIILSSFTNNRLSIKPSEYTVYTDGSKTENGTGAGIVIYKKRERIHTNSFSLPDSATVFQAEIVAIYQAMLQLIRISATQTISYVKNSATHKQQF